LKHERVVAFAARCERWSVERPALYDLSVAAFALLGAAYPLILFCGTILAIAALALVLHGLAALFFWKVVWFLAVPLFDIGRSLFRKPQTLPGRRLKPDDAPELFATLETLRHAYRTPRLDGVYLATDFQAAVAMRPRFGVFGGTEHNLILGLPALLALEMHHVKAVLAHEFGHMTQGRRSFDRFIYAVRSTIAIVLSARVPTWLHPVLRIFFSWWYPRFEVSSLVIARRVEREADRLAADTVGAKVMAEALVAFAVQDLRLARDFWPSLQREAVANKTPPTDVPERQMALLETPLPNVAPLLELALVAVPNPGDTHPVLSDRLKALGIEAVDATAFLNAGEIEVKGSAAAAMFGSSLTEVLTSIGEDWAAGAQESWSTTWGTLQSRRKALKKLEESAVEAPLGDAESRKRALLAAELYREDARLLLEAQVAEHPDDAALLLQLGRLLLTKYEDPRGIDFLERATRADPKTAAAVAQIGNAYLILRRGREETGRFLTQIANIQSAQGR